MGEEDYFDYSDVDVDDSGYNTVIEGKTMIFPVWTMSRLAGTRLRSFWSGRRRASAAGW
jgi:hypothetical protein